VPKKPCYKTISYSNLETCLNCLAVGKIKITFQEPGMVRALTAKIKVLDFLGPVAKVIAGTAKCDIPK
jgi:hypothetical protein